MGLTLIYALTLTTFFGFILPSFLPPPSFHTTYSGISLDNWVKTLFFPNLNI